MSACGVCECVCVFCVFGVCVVCIGKNVSE